MQRSAFPTLFLALFLGACSDSADSKGSAPAPADPAAGSASSTDSAPARDPLAVVTLENTANMDPEVVALVEKQVELVRQSPADPQVRGNLGLVYEANTMWVEAQATYTQAAALCDEKQPEAGWLYRRAIMQRMNGDLAGGLETMRGVASVFTRTPSIQARLGEMAFESGLFEEAASAYQRGADVDPRVPHGSLGLARVRLAQDRPQEAVDLILPLLEKNPNYVAGRFTLGQAYRALGRTEEAAAELAVGVDSRAGYPLDPHTTQLREYAAGFGRRMGLVENLILAGELTEALNRLEKLREEHPDKYHVVNLMARVYMVSGGMQEAYQLLQESVALDPGAHATRTELCAAALNTGRVDEALVQANAAIEIAPQLGSSYYFRGLVHMQANRLQEALADFELAEKKGATNPELFFHSARIYASIGQMEGALRYAALAAQKAPRNYTMHLLLAQIHATAGNLIGARKAFGRAQALNPTDPDVLQLARALDELEGR